MNFVASLAGLLLRGVFACSLVAASLAASAATSDVSSSGLLVTLRQETTATPHQVYDALGKIGQWWSSEHTWSGHAENMSMETQATSCWCERWDRNSVEHGHVLFAKEDSVLRLAAMLGPLQALGVNGVLTFTLSAKDGKTLVLLTYRVAGNASSGLDSLAAPVDGVLGEQLARLVKFAETGKPE